MAFALGSLSHPTPPTRDLLYLSRSDAESATGGILERTEGIEIVDWLEEPTTPLREQNQSLSHRLENESSNWHLTHKLLSDTYEPLARERLARGCHLLSSGRVVITDRLHGHILCLLMGIPHVLLDNNYGKNKHYYETWTHDSPITRWAHSPAEAIAQGKALLLTEG